MKIYGGVFMGSILLRGRCKMNNLCECKELIKVKQ